MSTHDYNIANASGASVRADINAALDAIVSNNASATAPSTTFPHQWWMDESTNVLRQRNAANTAWEPFAIKDGSGFRFYHNGVEILPGSVFIASATANSDAVIAFTGFDAAKYDAYEFHLQNVIPATDATNLLVRLSNNAGSSYRAGASDYGYAFAATGVGDATPAVGSSAASTAVSFSGQIGNQTDEGFSGKLIVLGAGIASRRTRVTWQGTYRGPAGVLAIITGGGEVQVAEANDALRFLFSSGNIASGTITMYGLRNA